MSGRGGVERVVDSDRHLPRTAESVIEQVEQVGGPLCMGMLPD